MLSSYLGEWNYFVSCGNYKIRAKNTCRVPQGFMLRLLLFNIHTIPLAQIMRYYLSRSIYADNMQLLCLCDTTRTYSPSQSVQNIYSWMGQNILQYNVPREK